VERGGRLRATERDAAMGWERNATAGLLLALRPLGCVMGGPSCIGPCWPDGPAVRCAAVGDGGPSCGARQRGGRAAAQPRHIGGSASGRAIIATLHGMDWPPYLLVVNKRNCNHYACTMHACLFRLLCMCLSFSFFIFYFFFLFFIQVISYIVLFLY
jgi:hypothetical protein